MTRNNNWQEIIIDITKYPMIVTGHWILAISGFNPFYRIRNCSICGENELKLNKLVDILDAIVITGEEHLDMDLNTAFSADLMSDF